MQKRLLMGAGFFYAANTSQKNHILSRIFDAMTNKDKKQVKLDKRAEALKANMRRRKERVKEIKELKKSDEQHDDKNTD